MMYEITLEDVAAELTGVSAAITCLADLAQPKQSLQEINTPTETTLDSAFFAITRQIDRIADHLNEFAEMYAKKAATPTDESKDCR